MHIHCSHSDLVDINTLKPHPKNRNKHPKDQIVRLARILAYQGWRHPVKVSTRSGFVTAGHGRIEAAKVNKWTQIPVDLQDYESDEQEYADVQADNAIASWAELELESINLDLAELGPNFDLDMLGIEDFVLDPSERGSTDEDNIYTRKIESPIYEPQGPCPPISALVDLNKTAELLAELEPLDLDTETKDFLRAAAQRHVVFNYEQIAEFYSHASQEVKQLMEKSALVIIDFDQAIENGFVVLTKELADEYSKKED